MSKHILATKKETVAHFKEKLATDDRWAVRGLMRIYQFQTPQEQASEQTQEDNGVGFTGADSAILTSFAKQFQRRGFLTENQLNLLKRRIPKYAGQLYNITNGK